MKIPLNTNYTTVLKSSSNVFCGSAFILLSPLAEVRDDEIEELPQTGRDMRRAENTTCVATRDTRSSDSNATGVGE